VNCEKLVISFLFCFCFLSLIEIYVMESDCKLMCTIEMWYYYLVCELNAQKSAKVVYQKFKEWPVKSRANGETFLKRLHNKWLKADMETPH
jgi:hypothetical protein